VCSSTRAEAARSEHPTKEEVVVDITIESVIRVRVSAIEENEIDVDDDEDDDQPFYRSVSIVTESGQVIDLNLYAASVEALELVEDDD
jgi:hypothetical protein